MEPVRMRDDDSGPPPVEIPDASLIQAEPFLLTPNRRVFHTSLPPSITNSRSLEKSPAGPKPLFQGFERPSFSRIAILTVLCLITYPAFYILTFVAKDRSLFIVRLVVSLWCSGVGFALGYILLKVGAQHLEAATWATVIHMSYEGGDGMKLRDLARGSSNPTSFVPAFHVLRSRFGNRDTSMRSRKTYDKRPWSLFLGFFVILAILGPTLPFLFGRVVVIKAFVRNQRKVYQEILIAGDLSKEDVDRAIPHLKDYAHIDQTWYSTSDVTESVYGSDTIYFAQPTLSQFVPGGTGVGTFNTNQSTSIILKDSTNNSLPLTGRNAPKSNAGAVLRYPQWGIRNYCEKLPDPEVNLIARSPDNYTYAYVPQDFIQRLFGVFDMDPPTEPIENPNIRTLDMNNTIPSSIDPSTISYIAAAPDNNEGVTLYSVLTRWPSLLGSGGWWSVETVLIRFDNGVLPSGRFPVHHDIPNPYGTDLAIGYDAAVCIQKYEPWVAEAYNTSILSPSTIRLVGKGDGVTQLLPSGNIQGPQIASTRYLNATGGKNPAFVVAHDNSVDQMWKVNVVGRVVGPYLPSITATSLTDGEGRWGYTELSPDRFAVILGRISAAYTLPYLAGSAPVVAQSYQDETVAYATYTPWQLIGLPLLVWILGVAGELFVPALPLDVPRREFGIYSWLALFRSQELKFEAADDLDRLMRLDELEEKFSDKRVGFVVEKSKA